MKWTIPAALVGCLVVSVGCDPNKKTSPSASLMPPPASASIASPVAPSAPPAQYTPPPVQQPVVYDAPQQAQPALPAAEPADVAEPASDIAIADTAEPAPAPMLSRGTSIHHTISASRGGHYTIKKGDSLWSIAQAHYGNGNKWKLIARANPKLNPNRLFVGTRIVLP